MMDVFRKAVRLVEERRVKQESEKWYKVKGDTEEHLVYFDGSKVSCDCRYYALHGTTKGYLCSHIVGVILYKYLKDKRT